VVPSHTNDPTLSAVGSTHGAALRYWQRARALTLALLLAWGGVTFGATWFARDLDYAFFGWPLGYWAAAQGALLVYLLLIALYAWVMDALDRAAGLPEATLAPVLDSALDSALDPALAAEPRRAQAPQEF
jgi:putative solute:sodium symporter small subunit